MGERLFGFFGPKLPRREDPEPLKVFPEAPKERQALLKSFAPYEVLFKNFVWKRILSYLTSAAYKLAPDQEYIAPYVHRQAHFSDHRATASDQAWLDRHLQEEAQGIYHKQMRKLRKAIDDLRSLLEQVLLGSDQNDLEMFMDDVWAKLVRMEELIDPSDPSNVWDCMHDHLLVETSGMNPEDRQRIYDLRRRLSEERRARGRELRAECTREYQDELRKQEELRRAQEERMRREKAERARGGLMIAEDEQAGRLSVADDDKTGGLSVL
ncbi:hypothetical protein A3B32_02075 [Candidatus Uhrbacteria bacterium RIFCSPLOWO2_01_FULL_53_9]|uniref:Uncharacterized protein n=3 Tax=Candidatus Uhriibacteriota TaxID=1752732 RepID=A0A1F7UWW3_9BACT|nr:MAG: hypothetical protein A3C17_00580 [Candidatus Uhrbacteria bacterium RIFCSPHIGHO2_02_FULL_53_13]OGL82765.1 MAG: hypothetical protein A3B32_02075 [Candidatus Uhrbacteria bacterium RIFCSPLOWO2_01_FULL_53_9]OGL90387.1 MAG: hypothetical protein A3I45_03650 [Candidatus Uhrbacteria bacterium RIFCSPLOWO2_02_FULL_53_10]